MGMLIENMRMIIILGIDALEYKLVEEFRLSMLQQEKYCKLDLSGFKVVVTPPIWGSMVTGKIDHEIMERFTERAKVVGKSKEKMWAKILAKMLPQSVKNWADEKKLIPRPFAESANFVVEKQYPTLFDRFEKSWHNGIPGMGRNVSDFETKQLMKQAVEGDMASFLEKAKRDYRRDKKLLLNTLRNDNLDLIFWYTDFLDKMGHALIDKKMSLMKHYMDVNQLVTEVKKICSDATIFIISDHGMKPTPEGWGEHSAYGFFSSNNGATIEKPQDLFSLIHRYTDTDL